MADEPPVVAQPAQTVADGATADDVAWLDAELRASEQGAEVAEFHHKPSTLWRAEAARFRRILTSLRELSRVTAPPAQTVAEVEEMLDRFSSLVVYAPDGASLEEARELHARLLSIVSCAAPALDLAAFLIRGAPPEGVPSRQEMEDGLSAADEELRKAATYYSRQGWWDSENDVRTVRSTVRALLSRLSQHRKGNER